MAKMVRFRAAYSTCLFCAFTGSLLGTYLAADYDAWSVPINLAGSAAIAFVGSLVVLGDFRKGGPA
jgi:hypothetical protein